MKILDKIKYKIQDIISIMISEFSTIATSYAILLVLIGGIFVYGFLYNYMYAPNLIRNAPIAVVDNSRTALSREYTRLINAAPQVSVYTNAADFPEAKELMKKKEVIGIIYIPEDFDVRVNRGNESIYIMYGTTDAFLYYLAMQESSSGAMMAIDEKYRPEMLVFLPQQDTPIITQSKAISVVGTALYNHTEGYGSYLIPAVLMVIIFQTLLMVIGMISGDEKNTGALSIYAGREKSFFPVSRIVLGKTFVYCSLYFIFSLFLLGLMPVLFSLPNIGHKYEITMLMIPYLLASSFFGLAASVFYTDSESPLLMIAFFSVGLIFLSGVSYPLELMPWYWKVAHFIIPAAPGTLAFVKINSMGASMADIRQEYITLWLQCIVYFIFAVMAYRYNIKKCMTQKTRKEIGSFM
ncbi:MULTISPECIES: ABC transporter permease [Bacteroidales]|jgi:putative membrane protein|uniref:ABC transporter permease n=1 Tax=Bacteroidales TaxID=171549 RepID=UPI0005744DDD|nr:MULTISPECIES: ABC transporter permease [Bacteroidales]KHM44928.1 ABC transporter permease [Coprobacter secundus]